MQYTIPPCLFACLAAVSVATVGPGKKANVVTAVASECPETLAAAVEAALWNGYPC